MENWYELREYDENQKLEEIQILKKYGTNLESDPTKRYPPLRRIHALTASERKEIPHLTIYYGPYEYKGYIRHRVFRFKNLVEAIESKGILVNIVPWDKFDLLIIDIQGKTIWSARVTEMNQLTSSIKKCHVFTLIVSIMSTVFQHSKKMDQFEKSKGSHQPIDHLPVPITKSYSLLQLPAEIGAKSVEDIKSHRLKPPVSPTQFSSTSEDETNYLCGKRYPSEKSNSECKAVPRVIPVGALI